MQVVVIGLGQFGMALARTLSARGVEVLAVDSQPDRVQQAASFAADAACFDAMDQQALAGIAPEQRDVCVCTMGQEAREASIVVTALLRQMGARRVIARAADDIHERILRLVGAHEVVNPDRAFGERFATHLMFRGVVAEVPLGSDLVLTEFSVPQAIVGRTLRDLALPTRHEITVVAVRRQGAASPALQPNPDEPLAADDVLVAVSPPDAVARFVKRIAR